MPSSAKRARVDAPGVDPVDVGSTNSSTTQIDDPSQDLKTCRLPAAVSIDERTKIRQEVTLVDRSKYYALNSCPIPDDAERRMEQVSKVVTSEALASCWDSGRYSCSRCDRPLYSSGAKFQGPCMWPSFREALGQDALKSVAVPRGAYNGYECEVNEEYCGKCHLFLGHSLKDGAETGDTHPSAEWRHCVLSLSLKFTSDKPT
eukprot:m.189802 g.189802  ORF g.189802 m.189802 type:complete len:203 (-) comp24864_c0_seq1:1075-1683(-)